MIQTIDSPLHKSGINIDFSKQNSMQQLIQPKLLLVKRELFVKKFRSHMGMHKWCSTVCSLPVGGLFACLNDTGRWLVEWVPPSAYPPLKISGGQSLNYLPFECKAENECNKAWHIHLHDTVLRHRNNWPYWMKCPIHVDALSRRIHMNSNRDSVKYCI
jgi:hypothetical protein